MIAFLWIFEFLLQEELKDELFRRIKAHFNALRIACIDFLSVEHSLFHTSFTPLIPHRICASSTC